MNIKAELNGWSNEKLYDLYRNDMHMDEITLILLERFNYYIKSAAKDMIDKSKNYCGEFDDLVSVGQIALLEFLRKSHRPEQKTLSPGIYQKITKAMQKEIDNNPELSQESLNMHKEDSNLSFVVDKDEMSPEKNIESVMLREYIETLLEHDLRERERQVIVLRFGLEDGYNRSLTEVGREFNLGSERIRQIEGKGLRKLRKKMYKYFSDDFNSKSNALKNNFSIDDFNKITMIDRKNRIVFIPYTKISIFGYNAKITENDMYTILRKFLISYNIKILSSNIYGMYIQYPSSVIFKYHYIDDNFLCQMHLDYSISFNDCQGKDRPILGQGKDGIIYLYPTLTCEYQISTIHIVGTIKRREQELFKTTYYMSLDEIEQNKKMINNFESTNASKYIMAELCNHLQDLLKFDIDGDYMAVNDVLKLLLF